VLFRGVDEGRVGPRPRRRRRGPVGLVGRGEGRVLVVAQVLVEGLQRRPLLLLLLLSFFSLVGRRDGDGIRRGGQAGGGRGRRRGGGGVGAPPAVPPLLRLPPLLQVDLREPPPPRAHDALVHVPGGVVVHAHEVGLLGGVAAGLGEGRTGCRGDGELPRPHVCRLLGVGPRPLHRRCELAIGIVAVGFARAGGLAAAHRRVGGGGGEGAGEGSRCGGGGSRTVSRLRDLLVRCY